MLQQLMEEYIEESANKEIVLDLKSLKLSDAQQDLLNLLIEKNVNRKSKTALFSACRGKGIYSRSHHFGEGLSSLVQNKDVPYRIKDEKVVPEQVSCSCEASISFSALVDRDFKCVGCDKRIVRF